MHSTYTGNFNGIRRAMLADRSLIIVDADKLADPRLPVGRVNHDIIAGLRPTTWIYPSLAPENERWFHHFRINANAVLREGKALAANFWKTPLSVLSVRHLAVNKVKLGNFLAGGAFLSLICKHFKLVDRDAQKARNGFVKAFPRHSASYPGVQGLLAPSVLSGN